MRSLMPSEIIGLDDWWHTPAGQRLLAWEQACLPDLVGDVFGFNAAQLGVPELDALAANRMPHRWVVHTHAQTMLPQPVQGISPAPLAALVCDPAALPWPENSIDLLVLPHTLEQSADPHETLREVERVLRPEGRVVVTGLNPLSWWALRQYRAHAYRAVGLQSLADQTLYLPRSGEFIGHWRLRDWMRLLGLEVQTVRFGVYHPAVDSERWFERWDWLDQRAGKWWPILGAGYAMVAVKRVQGMRLLGPAWKPFTTARAARVAPTSRQTARVQHKEHS